MKMQSGTFAPAYSKIANETNVPVIYKHYVKLDIGNKISPD